jgi:hypothetical protein
LYSRILISAALIFLCSIAFSESAVETLIKEFQEKSGLPFDQERGRTTWFREVNDRSCTSCHSDSADRLGRHQRTGKIIQPMAPSVNPDRLTNIKKVEKWFLRNCKWTYARECTPQEKGDILVWLQEQ